MDLVNRLLAEAAHSYDGDLFKEAAEAIIELRVAALRCQTSRKRLWRTALTALKAAKVERRVEVRELRKRIESLNWELKHYVFLEHALTFVRRQLRAERVRRRQLEDRCRELEG